MTAPRVCPMCMYGFVNANGHGCLECSLWQRIVSQDNTCSRWQIGYAGHKFEAEQAQQERIERAKRQAETPTQLDLFK